MALTAGTRLGPYEILAPLGAGGMGEVYKAEDARLDRIVAIKIIPVHLSGDPQLKERFEREARAVSSLNHPHICTLHDIGSENGIDFIVMEYIEGETLAERLSKRPLPLDRALRCAIEVADALDKAHRAGVVHRDLKPGNIMLTKSGAKLLDFGLAKLSGRDEGGVASTLPTEQKPLTREGSILGTLQYMAPEQLEGRDVDHRTDVFAFGALLYEMVTGKKAFEGKSQATLITAIMSSEPQPIGALAPMSPPALEHVVTRCLSKDAEDRWQSAADLAMELRWIANDDPGANSPSVTVSARRARGRLPWGMAAIALAGLALWSLLRTPPSTSQASSRLTVNVPEGQRLADSSFSFAPPMALSPDGTRLVYSATSGARPQLYLRHLDRFDVQPIAGTEGGTAPFFSPDGQWLGFFAHGELKKAPLAGGAPQTICDVPSFAGTGVTWGADGTIVFALSLGGLWRVSEQGGEPERLTTPAFENGEYAHTAPQFLPDGKHVLFSVWSGKAPAAAVLSLERGTWRNVLSQANGAMYVPTGHIVFGDSGGLRAVAFDPKRISAGNGSIPVVDDIHADPYSGRANFAVSEKGMLLYEPVRAAERSLVWVDRSGKESLVVRERAPYLSPTISPDGGRLLFMNFKSWGRSVWNYDLDRGTRTQVRSDGASAAIWSNDGRRITFASLDVGTWNLTSKSADGTGEAQALLELEGSQFPMSWSPDGQILAYYDYGLTSGRDIWMLPLGGEPEPFLATPFNEYMLRFSPDGRFVAYVSDQSGQQEVYVQPYPGPGERTIISTEGGRAPVWSRDGRELFYRNGDQMLAVSLKFEDSFVVGEPQLLFTGHYASDLLHNYDVAPDGQRFLMIREDEQSARPRFHVVLNWFSELGRLVPTDN